MVTTRPREGSEGADTRYWVGVASRDHVRRGAEGGFCQLGHGKAAPVERLSPGDWIAYYSPRTEMRGGETVQAFTAIGTVEPGEPYRADQSADCHPVRRDVAWRRGANDAQIRPLLELLDFTRGQKNWGICFRRGSFEVSRADFTTIAEAMGVPDALPS
ncbi:MAG: EVE domain-containing protein [Actinobacteria bacterium]|nr:EVE domain-containing protein [Actinomycetota bacterium]